MKTAISIPDHVFEAAEQLARRLGMSRSELYARAVEGFLRECRGQGVREALDAVYGENAELSRLDETLAASQHRLLADEADW